MPRHRKLKAKLPASPWVVPSQIRYMFAERLEDFGVGNHGSVVEGWQVLAEDEAIEAATVMVWTLQPRRPIAPSKRLAMTKVSNTDSGSICF
ncbi:hypothetical protein A4R29_05580 [Mesorhizobium ciceri biovar biserrulae]|nr:hypothetical protein A4R29_05580 [Mesorhizobium ciceri biovar biserrulae]